MPLEINIRKADIKDAKALEKISVETFIESFADKNTEKNMDMFLKECFNIDVIKREILDADIRYFMAFLDSDFAGYIKVSKAVHPDLTNNGLELKRIYVYKKYQGKKVGSALMQFAIELSKRESFEVLWLGVWEYNPKAIDFYKRWGFEVFGSHIFKLGTDNQNDLLMRKRL